MPFPTAIFNQLAAQMRHDSGALLGLSAVVHQFKQPGPRVLSILQNDAVAQRVPVTLAIPGLLPQVGNLPRVSIPWPIPTLPVGDHPRIDLGRLGALDLPSVAGGAIQASAQGFVLFQNLGSTTPHAVRLEAPNEPNAEAFDSRTLGPGDLFSTVLLRPGTYQVTNANGSGRGTIVVAYPVVGATPYRPPDPVSVTCDAGGFTPASVQLQPAQGIVFRVNAPARIVVELVTPDNGPARPRT